MCLSMPEIGVKRLRGSKGRVRQTKRGQSVSKGAIASKENKKGKVRRVKVLRERFEKRTV